MSLSDLVDHGYYIVIAYAHRCIHIIHILHQGLPMQLLTHQQGPHRNRSQGTLQILHNWIVLLLHLSPKLFILNLTYRPLWLVLLLSFKSLLHWHITCTSPSHTLRRNDFNRKPRLSWIHYMHQGDNLLGYLNHKEFIFLDAQRSHEPF